MEETKPKKVRAGDESAIDSNSQYAAAYLKTGTTSGVMYELKILTSVAWKLMCSNDASIDKWWLATEVANARGFHDLVLKYSTNGKPNGSTSDGKYMYRFMQIRHKKSMHNAKFKKCHLTSMHKLHRQGSLIYLFKSYVNMLDTYEKITPDQIVDLTIFTNMGNADLHFLVPVENDRLYGFKGIGKTYRIDIKVFQKQPLIMVCLQNIISKKTDMPARKTQRDDEIIFDFLRKLVFALDQPSKPELEKLIVEEMGKTFNVPQIFYHHLYKNIIDWFLIYNKGTAPYLTEDSVMQYLKDAQDLLWEAKKTEMLVDPVSKIADKLNLLSL
ncbi:PREDICTED: uncharacterized protein LOC105562508 [Vollenhovia emeryi]|uniref:uncharacterized protein LOC105562508 n=1 Tax=Vollenhovia emeryi TaxID=411798 RepID=UPI0005F523FD|nr:PREDICTED: uncharacterized protein LOC105562508 [Vollenhovia emeryi]